MYNSSQIHLNKSALKTNLEFIRSLLSKETKLSIVVKSNAYGHGLNQFTKTAYEFGADHFSVFCYDEAQSVKKNLPKADVMIMGWISDNDIIKAIRKGIEFYIFEIDRLEKTLSKAKKINIPAKIHLELETGMNRTGLNEDEFFEAIRIIKENRNVFNLKGICSHLAGPESQANYFRIRKQIERFNHYKKISEDFDLIPEYYHLANSAGLLSYPEVEYDMVRTGIISYGLWPSKETFISYITKLGTRHDPLKRVISWKSKVMSVKEIKTGEFVGYGNYYLANDDMQIAIIPVGYSNSFNRSLTNRGRVLIRGVRCSVIGVVNMNMIIADVTNIPFVSIGDEAVLIGRQGDLQISISSFSDYTDQLNYETLSNLPLNIPRYLRE
jgi:alanine racemase